MSSNDPVLEFEAATPVVSVVMAVNRDDGFLTSAIESILTQSMQSLELLVVANNCSDELWAHLQMLATRDTRLRPLRTPLGQLPYNLNVGLHQARGEFIARMDADDLALPDRLARQLHFLRANPSVSVVGGNYEHIDERGHLIGQPTSLRLDPDKIHERMPYESCIPHPTVMMRRADAIQVGGYAYGLYAEDWDLWLRMRRAGKRFANIPDLVLLYRIHAGQSTSLQAARRNIANVQALLLRELILTANPTFALSMLRHLGFELLRIAVALTRRVFPKRGVSQ
ncbi:glycosyltransferase [Roseateles sp. LKC17W]|uniref:Glycosyltransferase n=1 Tax=Pelomonas margarita TaxID=3299031 RepID=A0ABW7FK62_9BURK